jgi:hypothetical protein
MNHFTIWQWVDFARGVAGESDRAAMDAHLASGCARCTRVVTTLRRVTAIARAEADAEPPEGAIRYAKALFSLYRPEKSGFGRLIGRLIHDSALAPLPAGMRAEARSTRYLLYQAGSYYLDVQVQHDPESARLTFVGQLSDRAVQPTSTANLPIWLMDRKGLVASAFSNRSGEFQLECAPARTLQLRVPLPALGKRMDVSLNSLTKRGSGRNAPSRARPSTASRPRRKI